MANFYDLIDTSAQLVKRIPIRSVKEIPLVIPVDYPTGNFNVSRKDAEMGGEIYRVEGHIILANNAFHSSYVYSPTYPYILSIITYAVGSGAQVRNQLFEKSSVPSDITPMTGKPVNVNRWKFSASTSYVVVGIKSTVTTGDEIADWVSADTPYLSARYICKPATWYICEKTNIGNQTYTICYDVSIQEQIQGHESAT